MKLGQLADICGWMLVLAVLCHVLGTHGTRWEMGRYGMPVALLTEDGQHYQDGALADPISVWLVRNDAMELFFVGAFVLIGGLAAAVALRHARSNPRIENVKRDTPAEPPCAERRGEPFIARIVADAYRMARRIASTGKRGL